MPGVFARSGTFKAPASWAKHAGVWKRALGVWAKSAGAWQKIAGSITGATATDVGGTGECYAIPPSDGGTGSCTASQTYRANPINGIGPFTYQWEHLSGSVFTADPGLNVQTVALRSTGPGSGAGNAYTGYYRCKVTDTATGEFVYTPTVAVTLTRYLDSGNN